MMYAVNYPSGWQDVYDVTLNGSRLQLKPNDFHKIVPNISHNTLLEQAVPLDSVPRTVILINDRFIGMSSSVPNWAILVKTIPLC